MAGATMFDPGNCGCTTSCSGQICVAVTKACGGAAISGATVSVTRHSDGAPIGTTTTDASGNACVSISADDYYDVAVSATGCGGRSLVNQHCACTTNSLAIALYCSPTAGRTFTVKGCNNQPLPGATVSLSGPASASGTTDASGQWTWYPTITGTYTLTISPPSSPPLNRFNTFTSTYPVSSLCTSASPVYTLSVLAGYSCCNDGVTFPAFPIPNTLTLTDPGGSGPVTGSCSWSVCLTRSMDHASTNGLGATCTLSGGGTQTIPPALSTLDVLIRYYLDLTGAYQRVLMGSAGPYRADCLTSHAGGPVDSCGVWRVSGGTCSNVDLYGVSVSSSSMVISSWYPFSATYNFPAGTGWVTTAAACNPNGQPYASGLMLNE
ncbi:MSCRAMM family protein [Aquisphaera insulae]|uniref:MSCRAMM family protein n=1 Tax=Aquisphaera insulae TaxID=2712864 RepID=UPI0013EA513A|nr:carboxypeptidase regulatory-like domain-containing protein [Aquisphaera insulae]